MKRLRLLAGSLVRHTAVFDPSHLGPDDRAGLRHLVVHLALHPARRGDLNRGDPVQQVVIGALAITDGLRRAGRSTPQLTDANVRLTGVTRRLRRADLLPPPRIRATRPKLLV